MPLILGKDGVNREIKEGHLGVGGINKKINEAYIGQGGVNKKIYTGTLFELASVPVDGNIKPFQTSLLANSIEVQIYATGARWRPVIHESYGGIDLVVNCTNNLQIVFTNRVDSTEEGTVSDGAEIHFYVNGIYKDIAGVASPYSTQHQFKALLKSDRIECYYSNGMLSYNRTYSSLGISSRPSLVSYKAANLSAGYTTGNITNFIIK